MDAESLQKIADQLNAEGRELLCDADHGASRPGLDRNTHALGWFSKFFVDPMKGMFAKLKLTKRGRELVEGRDYRFLSPSFTIGGDGKPVSMTSVSMTNTPAMEEMPPILNSAPADAEAHQEEKEDTEMTKEEIQELVRSTVEELLAARAENACSDDEKDKPEAVDAKPDDAGTAAAEDTPADPETPETPADPEAPADPDSPETSTTDAEPKAEEKKEEEREVIKEEVLNQAPENAVLNAEPEWKKLHGRAFFQYITSHPEVCKS